MQEQLTPDFGDYELIDTGDFEKLERFGRYVTRRPEPQAIWRRTLAEEEWRRADASFRRDARSDERGQWSLAPKMPDRWVLEYAYRGMRLRMRLALTSFKHVGIFPEQAANWNFIYDNCRAMIAGESEAASAGRVASGSGIVKGADVRRTAVAGGDSPGAGIGADAAGAGSGADAAGTGIGADVSGAGIIADASGAGIGADVSGAGIGVDASGAGIGADVSGAGIIADASGAGIGADARRGSIAAEAPKIPKVLNLFAYTGGATLAARAAGAEVTHVDSVKQVVTWSRENMELSGLEGVRWIVEDALKFVQREVRRGSRYHGIILDPPAYGRGANGEKWVLEDNIGEMLECCSRLLEPAGAFLVLNLYSMGLSATLARTAVRQAFGTPREEQWGELCFTDRAGKQLPLGTYYRFRR